MTSTRYKGIKIIGDTPKDCITAVKQMQREYKNMVTCVYCYRLGVKNCKNG